MVLAVHEFVRTRDPPIRDLLNTDALQKVLHCRSIPFITMLKEKVSFFKEISSPENHSCAYFLTKNLRSE